MFKYLNKTVTDITNTEGYKQVAKNKEEAEAYIRKHLNSNIEQQLADASSISSPFHELSPAKMLMIKDGPILPDSPVGKAIAPLATYNGPIRPEIVVGNIESQFKNPNEAGAAVAQYYKANMGERNKVIPSGGLGMTINKNYLVQLPNGWSTRSYNLTDAAQATQYIQAKRAIALSQMHLGQVPPVQGFNNPVQQ